jgi:hypothetical protein
MLKAQGKKLGWTTALGQAAFILASRILSWQASARGGVAICVGIGFGTISRVTILLPHAARSMI